MAALAWAALGWIAASRVAPHLPEGPGVFALVHMGLGIILGWQVAAAKAGRGWVAAVGNGLTTTVALVCAGLVLHSGTRMIQLSLLKMYRGPVEALFDVFGLFGRYLVLWMRIDVMVILLIGAVVAGLLTEAVQRVWR